MGNAENSSPMDTHGSTWTEHVHVTPTRKPSLPFDSLHPFLLQQQRALSSQGAHSDTVGVVSFPTDPSKARFMWPTVPSPSCQQEHCPRAVTAGTVQLAVGTQGMHNVHSTSQRTAPPACRATNHDDMLRCHLKARFSLWSLPQPRAGSRSGL